MLCSFPRVLLVSLACSGLLGAQTHVKANVATALLGVPQVGLERRLGERVTFQVDLTASLWRSFDGAPFQFGMLVPEWRYHPRGRRLGPFIGAHLGGMVFRLQKWDHRSEDEYQEGFGVLIGGSAGYQWRVGRETILEVFVGGGNTQSLYKGYSLTTGERYDGDGWWNKSAEWLPYRGGVMLSIPLR